MMVLQQPPKGVLTSSGSSATAGAEASRALEEERAASRAADALERAERQRTARKHAHAPRRQARFFRPDGTTEEGADVQAAPQAHRRRVARVRRAMRNACISSKRSTSPSTPSSKNGD